MSWLVSSIANSLKLDHDDDDYDIKTTNTAAAASSSTTATTAGHTPPSRAQNPNDGVDDGELSRSRQIDTSNSSPPPDRTTPPRGVKEDLSELSKTLTRQFWGVASFIAPPPPISDRDHQSEDPDPNTTDPTRISGIRNDLSEIGGKFRTGITKLSSNKAVTEFTKMASSLLQFGMEGDLTVEDYARRGVVGVTEEVVAFARDVAMHPETWLDFPLPDDDDEEDFDLSDAQQEHALAVERLAPELAALRMELCLGYMTESLFWKIYFVLVHPRLSRHDAVILSTPEIFKARAMLTQDLHSRGKSTSYKTGSSDDTANTTELSHQEHLSVPEIDQSESVPVEISPSSVTSTEIPVIDKTMIEEIPMKQISSEKPISSTSKSVDQEDEDDADDWLKEETTETSVYSGTSYRLENDDDVSFSDLEEDEDVPTSHKKGEHHPNSSSKESRDWVQLSTRSADSANSKVSSSLTHNPEIKESNDWLDVEDIDVA